jgi:hypothetical protein
MGRADNSLRGVLPGLCVWVCVCLIVNDLWTSTMRRHWPNMGLGATEWGKTCTINRIIQFRKVKNIAVNYIWHNKTKTGPLAYYGASWKLQENPDWFSLREIPRTDKINNRYHSDLVLFAFFKTQTSDTNVDSMVTLKEIKHISIWNECMFETRSWYYCSRPDTDTSPRSEERVLAAWDR